MSEHTTSTETIRTYLEHLDQQYTDDNVRKAIASADDEYRVHSVRAVAQEYGIISQAARMHLAMHAGAIKLDEAESELNVLRAHWRSINPNNYASVSSVMPIDTIFRISLSDTQALTSLESILMAYPALVRS